MIVTDNVRNFPGSVLAPLGLEVVPADAFLADALDLNAGRAVAAVRRMRDRFRRPEMDAEALLRRLEADGLGRTAAMLRKARAAL